MGFAMEAMPFILVVAGLLVAAAIGYLVYRAQKKRREALAAVAAQMGWHFDPRRDRSHDDEYAHFDIFRRGHSRAAHNTLTGELEIDGRPLPREDGRLHLQGDHP